MLRQHADLCRRVGELTGTPRREPHAHGMLANDLCTIDGAQRLAGGRRKRRVGVGRKGEAYVFGSDRLTIMPPRGWRQREVNRQ